jgi:adenosylhomocysteine nucleosidase
MNGDTSRNEKMNHSTDHHINDSGSAPIPKSMHAISGNVDQPLLIVAPTKHEFNAVQQAVKDLLSGGQIELAMSGMGLQAVEDFCRMLERRDRPLAGLALLGWAGGLSPDLQAGDVIVASSALGNGESEYPCKVLPMSGAIIGPVLTVPVPTLTPQEKDALRSSGALAVEMEAYPFAAWAHARGLPFIHVRVVLDTVDEILPDLGSALDIYGRVNLFQFAKRLFARPLLIGQLYHLYRRIGILDPSLGCLARAVVQSWFEQFPMTVAKK